MGEAQWQCADLCVVAGLVASVTRGLNDPATCAGLCASALVVLHLIACGCSGPEQCHCIRANHYIDCYSWGAIASWWFRQWFGFRTTKLLHAVSCSEHNDLSTFCILCISNQRVSHMRRRSKACSSEGKPFAIPPGVLSHGVVKACSCYVYTSDQARTLSGKVLCGHFAEKRRFIQIRLPHLIVDVLIHF